MSFEERVLKGVGLHGYTCLLTKENRCSRTKQPQPKKSLRVKIAEIINPQVLRVRRVAT